MAHVAIGDAQDNLGGVWQDKTQLYALAGNDTMISDNQNDFLIVGGSGDDSLIMYGGKGSISGGAGKDTFDLTYSADKKLSAVIEDLDPANDKIVVNFDGDAAPQLTSSVSGNDVIWRDSDGFLSVTLKGVRENDYFDGTASNETWEVLEITNNEREAKNLPWLTMSADLMQGASVRAQEITALGLSGILTDHTRPNGEDFSTVLKKEYVSPPHENLEAGAASAAEVMENWMDSTTHRENILNPDFNKLGVGYNYQDDGDPTHHRYYWTQLFADSLKSPETVSTADLLTANIEVNTVKKFVTLTEDPDTYSNTDYSATIAALGGADSITNTKPYVSISGGADNDTIVIDISATTVNAGTGDDIISLSGDAQGNYLEYSLGDGNDTIYGFNVDNALVFLDSEFTPVTLGNDIIISVGADSITLADAEDFYYFGTRSKLIIRTEKDDEWENTLDDATIQALAGNDYVVNSGKNVIIDGDDDNDYIYNWGETVSIGGGNGNDTVWNLGKDSTIDAGNGSNYINSEGDRVSIVVGTDNDSIYNYGASVTIDTGDGINYIDNRGKNVIINGGADRDSLLSIGDFVTLNGNAGDDYLVNQNGSNVKMYGGDGNEWLGNGGDSVTMDAGAGNDTIGNWGSFVTMEGGAGDDSIGNMGAFVKIVGGDGNDSIRTSLGANVTIDGGKGNDTIYSESDLVTIDGGDGNEYIRNWNDSVSISGGAGNDSVDNYGNGITINTGFDNDMIGLWGNSQNNLIQYKSGDGRDTVWGFNETDTLQITGGTGFYSTLESEGDIFVYVGTGSILLRNAAGLSAVNISGRQREFREENTVVTLTEDPDTYQNTVEGMTILALGGADSITNSGANVSIDGSADDDYINTAGNNVTVEVGDGSDSIFNDGDSASLGGGDGKDFIANSGANVSMDGGKGDDFISLSSDSENNLIIYNEGDGNDTISGFKNTDVLRIFNQKFTRSTVGNDVVVKVGNSPGSVTLLDTATTLSPPYINFPNTAEGKFFTLLENSEAGDNTIDDATIAALGGDDTLENYGRNVSISGGDGDDYIYNRGENSTLDGNAGNDSISNYSNNVIVNGGDGDDDLNNYNNDNVLINGGEGNDSIYNSGVNVTIDAGAGNDYIYNSEGSEVTIDGGAGDDTIVNRSDGKNVTIDLGAGDDSVWNYADNVTILGSAGNDSIINDGASVTIDAGAGNDTVWNRGADVSILGGADDDTVANYGSNVTIDGGDGNDDIENEVETSNVIINSGNGNDIIISGGSNLTINAGNGNDSIGLSKSARNNVIQYNLGDGDDTLWGYSTNTTLNISEENVTSVASGDNMIIYVGDGSITLIDAREKLPHIVLGAGGTSGGGSGSSGGGGGSASGGGSSGGSGGSGGSSGGSGGSGGSSSGSGGSGGSSGGSGGSGGSSGGSGGSGGSSVGRTAVGSRGRSSSTSTDTSGSNVSGTTSSSSSRGGGSRIAVPNSTVDLMSNWATSTEPTAQTTATAQRVYSGGNQVVGDYVSGEKIVFGDVYTGSFYDGAGNYFVGSSTGALVIQNAADKVIDLSDAAGNSFVKAYSATTAGVIDGRGLTGFEIINGSAGSDAIFAGDGGSQLWGGLDVAADTMVGGGGADIFIGGRTQGADVILNASATDIVHLNDANLSDIIATEENNGAIAVAFNTGNVVAVQSTELLSATFMLSDGSAYRYNHATRNWQSATN